MLNEIIRRDMEEIYQNLDIDVECFRNKTILITGAYGMLASYLVYFLMYLHDEKGIDLRLTCVVRNVDKYYQRFDEKDYVEVTQSNLLQELDIHEKVDYIIHAASLASPQYYEVCPVDVLSPNVIGNYHLLNLAVRNHVEGYLLFSSCDVYGYVSDTAYVTETAIGVMDTLDIHNCYSESKRMAETMCKAFYVQHGVPVKIARIAHTYAPTMNIEHDPRVFASFVRNIVDHEDIVIKSDGTGKRPFCYITDAVIAYLTILINGVSGEAYNVANSEQYISVSELANTLVDLYPKRELKVLYRQRSTDEKYSENVLLKDHEQIPNTDKLEQLGWKPRVDVREGFRRVIEAIEG